MAKGKYLWDGSKWRPAAEVLATREPPKRSHLSAPLVIGSMPEIRSPIDGRWYDGKAEYYRHVERAGCAIVGFDQNWTDHIRPAYNESEHTNDIVNDIKKSIEQVESYGGTPPS